MLKTKSSLPHKIPKESHFFRSETLLYDFSPYAVLHPNTEAEIVQIIQAAAQQKLKVKTIGSLHSFAPIPVTEGVCIVLDQYKSLIKIDGSLVTVQAGMKILELNKILAQHNLALPILGAIDKQTVAGAISTGTHGGSFHYKSLSGYVQNLRIVRADGSVLEVDCSEDIFNAIVISLGLLGIISTVTFKCVPAFYLQSHSCAMSMDQLLCEFDDIHQKNKYVDIKYIPITDRAQVLLINPPIEMTNEHKSLPIIFKSLIERKLRTLIVKLILHFSCNSKFNWFYFWIAEQYEKDIYVEQLNTSDVVLTNLEYVYYEPIPIHNMEIAIPYSEAIAALTYLRNHFHKTRKYPNIYIRIRCSATEDFWLSPAYKQNICWLDFCEYPYTGEFFQEMTELLKSFNFRCHWGKEIVLEQQYLKQQYEKWHDFIELCQKWDSNRMFTNAYLDKLFGF